MKFTELSKSLNEIKSSYIIKGDDEYLKAKALTMLKSACVKSYEDFNYVRIDYAKSDMSSLREVITTLPFGGDTRMVVLDNVTIDSAFLDAVKKFYDVDGISQGTCLVFFEPKVKKQCNVTEIDCSKLDISTFEKWLLNYLNKYNMNIEKRAIRYITEVSSYDLAFCASELPKLVSYAQDNGVITESDAKLLLTKNENYFIYNLTSAIDEKNKSKYMDILNALIKTEMVGNVFAFMGTYFKRMFYISLSNESDDVLAEYLKIKPYAILKSRQYVNKNGKMYYITLFDKYVKLDTDIKSGKISPQNALYDLIF